MRRIGVGLRLVVLGLYLLGAAGLQLLALRFGWSVLHTVPMRFHRLFLCLFGVRVIERGTPPSGTATLVLSNHVSWLDIPVIGSLRPLSFIAKSEIEGWPVVGFMAKLQRSVFIDRARRGATAEVNETVGLRLAKGEVIVLFPEGTTSDGNRLLPFRSSIVGAAQAALTDPGAGPVHLQPLALSYTRRNGLPVTRRERPFIAWYADMDLAPHLAHFVANGALDVVVTWGEPVPFNGNRKQATAAAEEAVRRAIQGG
ncbi:lysophospholipid acyltransferase family protein [Microvirga pudoricolor]|uniref:lysophospholipid acyltransferase family protein n=1 Tax=Microvirga pudoricolor TaxID=2778729 RepID=UPI00194E7060|nr:lysophospholipid acyltransferase family protein [Microvirga pudoricolor]MBM6593887.1 1-acyl-sn-glycerol-3-phosphate acyltransferase [Microvirga pudoricolor]